MHCSCLVKNNEGFSGFFPKCIYYSFEITTWHNVRKNEYFSILVLSKDKILPNYVFKNNYKKTFMINDKLILEKL